METFSPHPQLTPEMIVANAIHIFQSLAMQEVQAVELDIGAVRKPLDISYALMFVQADLRQENNR